MIECIAIVMLALLMGGPGTYAGAFLLLWVLGFAGHKAVESLTAYLTEKHPLK